MLAWTIYVSFLGAGLVLLVPQGNLRATRAVALLTAALGFADRGGGHPAGQVGSAPNRHQGSVDSVAGHRVLSRGRRNQSHAGVAHGLGRDRRNTLLVEHRTSREGVLRALPHVDRRRVWRLPELRPVPAPGLLRAGDYPQVLPDRDLGLDPKGIWRHEAGPLLIRWERDGGDRRGCGLRRGWGQDHEPR